MEADLRKAIAEHPDEGVAVSSGGTKPGVGLVYEVVNSKAEFREKVKLIGVVSECAENSKDLAIESKNIIFVDDPTQGWETLNAKGDYSYGIYLAEKFGKVVSYGGGNIANKELSLAKERGIEVVIYPHAPNQQNLMKKLDAGGDIAKLTPVLTKYFK